MRYCEIPRQMYKPRNETLVCLGRSDNSVRVRALFTIHWFLNAAEMQQHSLEAEDQIITPAVLSLPKGGVAFTSPGFLLVLKTCLLPCTGSDACQALWWTSFHRLILSCPFLPYPLCLLGQFSTVLTCWKSSCPGGARGRSVWCRCRYNYFSPMCIITLEIDVWSNVGG